MSKTWGTWKDHGRADRLSFYGTRREAPAGQAVLVMVKTTGKGGITICAPGGEDLGHGTGNTLGVGAASKFGAAPAAKRTGKHEPGRVCRCSCAQPVTGQYKPGHDARHMSQLRQAYEAGKITRAAALEEAGHSSARLQAKLARSLELADERKAARKRIGGEAA